MYYTLSHFINYAASSLEMDLAAKRPAIEGHIFDCMRNHLPLGKFCTSVVADLPVEDGRVSLPVDMWQAENDTLYSLEGLTPNADYLQVNPALSLLRLRYKRMPVDTSGEIAIPEDFAESLILYLEAELIHRVRWKTQKGSRQDYEFAKRDFEKAVGRLRGRVNMLSPAEFERFLQVRQSKTLKPRKWYSNRQ